MCVTVIDALKTRNITVLQSEVQRHLAAKTFQVLQFIKMQTIFLSQFVDWSLRKLFGHPLKSSCPLAATSHVFIDVTENDVGSLFLHCSG